MAISVQKGHNAWPAARRPAQLIGLAALSVFTLATLLPIAGVAQDTPRPTPTMINPPSLPVRGPRVLSTPIPPGAMVPTPGEVSPPEHMIGITIAGEHFMMHPGPCAFRVEAAILAHDDLFAGDQACDDMIRQARAIQRQKEAEDPSYANEPRITPGPTPVMPEGNQTQQ